MSKLKRLKRKRGAQKQANIRQMSLQSEFKGVLGPRKLLKQMTRDHQDVLQNIEFILVSGYREDRTIDDRIVAEALRAAIQGDMPVDARARSLTEGLEEMRHFRSDVPDQTWRDGLRTVLQSVHRHSSIVAGSRAYLDFVCDFIG
jgi:hypothetical protein